MNLKEFTYDFIEDIRNDSIIYCDTPSNIFLTKMLERLQTMEYIIDPTQLSFYKAGVKGRIMKFDSFAFDNIDKSITLVSNEYIDDVNLSSLTQTDINQISLRMLNFLDEVVNSTIFRLIDPSHDVYNLSLDIKRRFDIDFIKLDNDESIDKIKLIIITNKKISNRVTNFKMDDFIGRSVELNVWDIERIFDIINSGKDKETILIDILKFNNNKGLPYLKAEFENVDEYDAYLSILPGKFLGDIYNEHGSRLLEGNVRAFLSARGKINRGIRQTILREPNKFFTYNNGIACTAKKLSFSEDGTKIILIEDFQIINGGQTTASLTSAWKKDNARLDNIYVPMKLTIVKSEEYDDVVQSISKFANSQNKVTDADLFSNHPFHKNFEDLSKKYIAPPKKNETHSTFWFYERAKGSYEQSTFKMTKKSEKEAFLKKYPKNQVIKKEALAKYLMAGYYLRPDIVSKGSAKNMNEFAKRIDDEWNKDSKQFNEFYFQSAVCYAIMYITTDKLVSSAEWYNVGGYKLNIVPYTVSKIMSSIPHGYSIDFIRIWREQALYDSFIKAIKEVAIKANDFIIDSKGIIVTEYAKKEETWNVFKDMVIHLPNQFLDDLTKSSIIDSIKKSTKQDVKLEEQVDIETKILELAATENGQYWNRLLEEGIRRKVLSITEQDILRKYVCELSNPIPKLFPSINHFKIAWKVRLRLEGEGVVV